MTKFDDQPNLPSDVADELNRLTSTYCFEERSKKGQNGYLFMAQNKVIDRKVAIKFYFRADGNKEHFEPKSLAAVKCESVIEILDAYLVGNEWAMFVTPHCKNGDLDEYCKDHKFGLRNALEFTSRLLEGVSALHENSFLHRDLKPENLLVSDHGWPLIADFGSVCSIPKGHSDVTASGHAALYRPPESFATNRYDRRGDIYQCGIVLFQVLGGGLSYSGLEYLNEAERSQYNQLQDEIERQRLVESAIKGKAQNGNLLDLKSLPFFVPKSIKDLIQKATSPEPSDRFQKTCDFMNDVHRLRNKVVDWRYDGHEEIAFSNSKKYRVMKSNGKFAAEKNGGNGWRRVSGSGNGTRAEQVNLIETLCRR